MLNLGAIAGFNPDAVQSASNTVYVCLMGIGIVFFGLICIVVLCSLMSAIFKGFNKGESKSVETPATPVAAVTAKIENKQEFIAAVSAAIAEEMGTDVSAIRIKSIKRI